MLKQGRFSSGQETSGDTHDKTRIGSFADGQALPSRKAGCPGGCSCDCGCC